MEERNKRNSDSTYFRIYVLVLGVYVAIRTLFALLVKIPACHRLSDASDRWSFFQFFKWIYQVFVVSVAYFCICLLSWSGRKNSWLLFYLLCGGSGALFCWARSLWKDKWLCQVFYSVFRVHSFSECGLALVRYGFWTLLSFLIIRELQQLNVFSMAVLIPSLQVHIAIVIRSPILNTMG